MPILFRRIQSITSASNTNALHQSTNLVTLQQNALGLADHVTGQRSGLFTRRETLKTRIWVGAGTGCLAKIPRQ
jgi:hypothetical protein